MENERWRNLEIWKLSDDVAFKLYLQTKNFPKEETYGITSQIRRAVLSIPTNIVEGYSRKGDKELAYFLNISLGSLAETKYLLYFSNRLGYITEEDYCNIQEILELLGKKLWKFYASIR